MSQQQLPFGYLSQIDSYLAALYPPSAAASPSSSPSTQLPAPAPAPAPPPPTTVDHHPTTGTSTLPDCYRTRRCDSCEMLFAEASPDEPRFTYPCGHVYCAACAARAATAAHRNNVHVFCHRCSNIIVRKRDNFPCTHQIPVAAFDARSSTHQQQQQPQPPPPLEDRYRLALGQRTARAAVPPNHLGRLPGGGVCVRAGGQEADRARAARRAAERARGRERGRGAVPPDGAAGAERAGRGDLRRARPG
ncbi:hypothetical protein PWT90_06819 [Aphanocladium album]|nr:hypothetical protein PWT90_06819 [Aphanocladium album]